MCGFKIELKDAISRQCYQRARRYREAPMRTLAPLSVINPPVTAIGGSYAATFAGVSTDASRKPCSAKKSQTISLAFGPRGSLKE